MVRRHIVSATIRTREALRQSPRQLMGRRYAFMPGGWEILLILLIVLIIFGAGRLPKVMGDLAKGIKSFKAGMKEEESGGEEPPKVTKSETAAAEESGREAKSGQEAPKT
jgi:sec-independent protein translocase protein TatA